MTKRWHPKVSMEDYQEMMFTTKNFEALTEGLSEMEIDAIKKGVSSPIKNSDAFETIRIIQEVKKQNPQFNWIK